MKKSDYSYTALPICTALGVVLGTVLDNLTMGIAFGAMAGTVLSCCGLFIKKDNNEDEEQ